MLWEAKTDNFNQIQIEDKKIAETFHGWYISSVVYPDNRIGSEINSLIITIKQDSNKED